MIFQPSQTLLNYYGVDKMAFDFLGTFTEEEIKSLLDFAEKQLPDVQAKIEYLRCRIEKIGWITYSIDDSGKRVSYSVDPPDSLLGKYIKTYQFYGGDVLSLNIKSRGQWLHFTKGEATLDSGVEFQGGKVEGEYYSPNMQHDDGLEAVATSKVKDWCIPVIQGKREDWEFKIKKAIDLGDQCLEEILLLVKRSTGAETLQDIRVRLDYYLTSPEFMGAGKKRESNG